MAPTGLTKRRGCRAPLTGSFFFMLEWMSSSHLILCGKVHLISHIKNHNYIPLPFSPSLWGIATHPHSLRVFSWRNSSESPLTERPTGGVSQETRNSVKLILTVTCSSWNQGTQNLICFLFPKSFQIPSASPTTQL